MKNNSLEQKKQKGKFYTTRYEYILEGLEEAIEFRQECCFIEPFAGEGHLIEWIKMNCKGFNSCNIEAYDIDTNENKKNIKQKDTLKDSPDYNQKFIITNPPYLARNKSNEKFYFDKYKQNDLYKCFIKEICNQNNCLGGIIIIPSGFFFSSRNIDSKLRDSFMSLFEIKKIKYFEETVFEDTTQTVVVVYFLRFKNERNDDFQKVEWVFLPKLETRVFEMKKENNWVIGGEIYQLLKLTKTTNERKDKQIEISRKIGEEKQKGETNLILCALDTTYKRICLKYNNINSNDNCNYSNKKSNRTYATIVIKPEISIDNQKKLEFLFNDFLEQKRSKYNSLFLPQFREATKSNNARKRIPFTLAYQIIKYLIIENDLICEI